MPLTFVTALYDVRANYKTSLLQQFHQLVTLLPAGSQLIVWTDFDDVEMNLPNTHVHDHVCICKAPLSSFTTYEAIMKRPLALPVQRNATKDTQAFMALMNTKVEMLWRAMPFVGTDGVAWIDAGICKIFRAEEMEAVKADLAAAHERSWSAHNTILIPGCWPKNAVDRQRVCWRFCGGYIVLPVHRVNYLFSRVQTQLQQWIDDGYVGWEVNLWADVEWQLKKEDIFQWFQADHNRTMMMLPPHA